MAHERTRAASKHDLNPFTAPTLEKCIERRDREGYERIDEEDNMRWELYKVERIAIVEELFSTRIVFDANTREYFHHLSYTHTVIQKGPKLGLRHSSCI